MVRLHVHSLLDGSIVRFVGCFDVWLVAWLMGWLVGCLFGLLVGLLVCCLVGRVVRWLIGGLSLFEWLSI